jgi:hypothetical protein
MWNSRAIPCLAPSENEHVGVVVAPSMVATGVASGVAPMPLTITALCVAQEMSEELQIASVLADRFGEGRVDVAHPLIAKRPTNGITTAK